MLVDILGLDGAQRSELVAFLRTEGSLLKTAGMTSALHQLDGSNKVKGWSMSSGRAAGMEHGWTLDYDEDHFIEARTCGHTVLETEEAYADDGVYFLRHKDPEKLLAAVRLTGGEFCKVAEKPSQIVVLCDVAFPNLLSEFPTNLVEVFLRKILKKA